MIDNRPIGVFDSGVGGLTVLRALQHCLPNESTIYLGDLARCPYGTRPPEDVSNFALQIGDLLVELGIKLLVVACNTATASAYHQLQGRYDIPVVGVIEPAVEEALHVAPTGPIGVVATNGTVASAAYSQAVWDRASDVEVYERSASWLVPLIERGTVARADVAVELRPVLQELDASGIRALILGCTHFPLVRDIFESELSDGIVVLDSAHTTARKVAGLLKERGIEAEGTPRHRLLVTGPAEAFSARARTMFRFSPDVETLDLPRLVPAAAEAR
ncbi:MAG: glutamate racemase [Chloroflexota bacterium]